MARSARLRLTLLYSGMFLALGTAIVVVIFFVGSHGNVVGSSSVSAVPGPPGVQPIVQDIVSHQHSADVDRLLAVSWVTLAVTAVVAAVLGWFLAGRVLRPLREMTTAAQTISAGNLHERLALTGPDDEFKQLGDTFDDLLGRLEASFAAQRRFVANAAHELRTPLTVERTVLQVALADPDANTASLRAACEELLASGRDHERLLDSLLTLATSERGLQRREPIGLAAIVGDVLESSQPQIERRSLAVTADLRQATINGDRALIESLVANLVDNAIRYSEPGGRMEVWHFRRCRPRGADRRQQWPEHPPRRDRAAVRAVQTADDRPHGSGRSPRAWTVNRPRRRDGPRRNGHRRARARRRTGDNDQVPDRRTADLEA